MLWALVSLPCQSRMVGICLLSILLNLLRRRHYSYLLRQYDWSAIRIEEKMTIEEFAAKITETYAAAEMAVEHRHTTHHRMIKIHNGEVHCLTCGWKWPEQADMCEE